MRKLIPPFFLGFIALSFQVLLLREFFAYFYGNEITSGILLGTWLFWGGIGSILASRIKFRPEILPLMYYFTILLFLFCLAGLRFSRLILNILPGELTGTTTILIYSTLLSLLISFPLGMLFVFNTRLLEGNVSEVYFLESLGSALAGTFVSLFFVPTFSNWESTALIGALSSIFIFLSSRKRKHIFLLLPLLIFLALFSLFDFKSEKLYWNPFNLIQSKDTPYGKLQLIKTEEQISLYNNSLLEYSYPDLLAAEESVHFALLQLPEARKILLLGGGAGGGLKQVLKYPQAEVDYVEIDPEIIRFSLRHLPPEERKSIQAPRVKVFYQDGRAFLKKVRKKYDAIVLNLPEPATAQINRFYTKEFFQEARKKLSSEGILSLRLPSAEDYISRERGDFLSVLYHTLKEVFPHLEVIPGGTNIFLASSRPLISDAESFAQAMEKLNLQNTFITRHFLLSRLSPLRKKTLEDSMFSREKKINRDLTPISYFFNNVLWGTQFRGIEGKIFTYLSRISRFWLLDFPLIIFLLLLSWFWQGRKRASFLLTPLALMGFSTITFEIIVLISFQTKYGYLYQRIALLLASFMAGLSLGALRGMKRKKIYFPLLPLIQFGFVLIFSFYSLLLNSHPPETFFFLALILIGYFGGDLFIISNSLFLRGSSNYGLGYGLDLLGAFLGALVCSSLLIPLLGLPILLRYLILINSFCVLFLILGMWRFKFEKI